MLGLSQCQKRPIESESSNEPCLPRKTGSNLVVDGDFEIHKTGQMDSPWISRPVEEIAKFSIVKEPSFSGRKHLILQGEQGDWWGVSQKIKLKQGKRYTASFLMKGDSAEVHCGAVTLGNFLGWDNSHVPNDEWQLISFDFYTRDSLSAPTTIYIAGRNPNNGFELRVDDLQVIEELPNRP